MTEPTDDELDAVIAEYRAGIYPQDMHPRFERAIMRAAIAKWGRPAPATQQAGAPQGETNVQLDIDSNHSAPGQQRDVARSVALGQPMGNGQDQAAGHLGAQGDKLLTVAERNIRSFLRSATFKSESDREAALNCVDVLWAAARAPADSVLEDAAQVEIDLFNDLNRIYGNTLTAYAKEMCRLGYRKTNAARKQARSKP